MPPSSHDAYAAHDLDPLPPAALLDMQHFLKKTQSREAFEDRRGTVVDAGVAQYWQGNRGAPMGYKFTSSEVPSGFPVATRPLDMTLYVGKSRTPCVLSIESLKGSAYFRSILERRPVESSSPVAPVVIDCDEAIFQHVMTVMRYGSFEALPKLSDVEMFKLKKELEFYGIQVTESPRRMAAGRSGSRASSPTASEAANSQHFSVADLPDFPVDLVDPAKLVLVSCLEDDVGRRCPCTADDKPSQWALNFHYRHAFCTGCGRPSSKLAPKFLAEMFMLAACYYSGCDQINPKKWSVGCDSTCTLKFLSSKACCSCLCSTQTTWAVSAYHSHAFCTHCGQCAEGSALVYILLALRYGGHHHRSPKGRRDHYAEEAPTVRSAPSKTATHGVH